MSWSERQPVKGETRKIHEKVLKKSSNASALYYLNYQHYFGCDRYQYYQNIVI